jgi:hypothetical protein
MRTARGAVVLLALTVSAPASAADENKDLDLIPQGIPDETTEPGTTPPVSAPTRQNLYLENALSLDTRRQSVVPFPPPQPDDWEERLFFDARREWVLGDGVSLALSDRFNFRAESDFDFPSRETIRNDFREGYASWEAAPRTYLDLGRINVKNGVAVGFNPTDFFKTRAVVEPLTADPAVLREDRLGTLMARAQHVWNGGAVVGVFAPALYQPSPVFTNTDLPRFDPMFDRTNAHDRWLLKGNVDITADFSPELLYYREGDRSHFGANITQSIGQSTIGYVEWAGGRRASLISDALTYGRQTGTLPFAAPSALPVDTGLHFQNDLAAGFSYTTETKITFNLEYHFHQAGFSRQDWDNWFRIGRANASVAPVTGELWFIRGYAAEQQEPISTHSTFLRADWTDAVVKDLEITGFVNTDLYDGSSLAQIAADYYLSRSWTIGVLAAGDLGRRRSDFGSLPTAETVFLKLVRYF